MNETNTIHFLQNNHSFSLGPLRKQHQKQSVHDYANSSRYHYGFLLLVKGEIKYTTPDENIYAVAGNLVFFPKNSAYEASFEGEVKYYIINFSTDVENALLTNPHKILNNVSSVCKDAYINLVEEYLAGNASQTKLLGMFYMLLDIIIQEVMSHSSSLTQPIQKAISLLEDDADMQIPEIAHICGVNESALRKSFQKEIGMSPKAYRLNFKLKKAKYLLESTNLSITEIANTLEFYDTAYFCKTFKSYTGITPMQYSKKIHL